MTQTMRKTGADEDEDLQHGEGQIDSSMSTSNGIVLLSLLLALSDF